MNEDSGMDQESWNRYLAERTREWHERAVQKEAVGLREWIEEAREELTAWQLAKAEERLSDER